MLSRFWFSPVLTIAVLALSYGIGFLFYANDLTAFTAGWGVTDLTTYACYLGLFIALFCYRADYAATDERRGFNLFCFFSATAFLREAGIQHWLTSTDTTAFKIRFFTNPNNPVSEKIVSALCLIAILTAFIYAMKTYLFPAFKGLFKLYAGSWTIITFLSCGAMCKIIDRIPSNLRKAGYDLPKESALQGVFEIAEETLEMMLPILAVVALMQFHKNKDLFFPHARRIASPSRSES